MRTHTPHRCARIESRAQDLLGEIHPDRLRSGIAVTGRQTPFGPAALGQQVDPRLRVPQEKPVVPVAEESIAAAIRDLKSDEYATREAARKELMAIGEPAVAALQDISKLGTLNSEMNGMSTLVIWPLASILSLATRTS